METICVKIKIKEDTILEVRKWFETLKNRSPETLHSLKNEGVLIESIFLDHSEDGNYYLIYYMKAKNLAYAKEIAKKSTLAIDQYHQNCKQSFCESQKPLELLADFSLIKALES